MHQGGLRHKAACQGLPQGGLPAEHPELAARDVAQHDSQGRFVEILDVIRRNAHTDSARPMLHLGQGQRHMIQDVLRMTRQMVGDVDQAQAGCIGISRVVHVGTQLRQHHVSCHFPMWMGGVAVGKQFHQRAVLRAAFFAGAFLAGAF